MLLGCFLSVCIESAQVQWKPHHNILLLTYSQKIHLLRPQETCCRCFSRRQQLKSHNNHHSYATVVLLWSAISSYWVFRSSRKIWSVLPIQTGTSFSLSGFQLNRIWFSKIRENYSAVEITRRKRWLRTNEFVGSEAFYEFIILLLVHKLLMDNIMGKQYYMLLSYSTTTPGTYYDCTRRGRYPRVPTRYTSYTASSQRNLLCIFYILLLSITLLHCYNLQNNVF